MFSTRPIPSLAQFQPLSGDTTRAVDCPRAVARAVGRSSRAPLYEWMGVAL